jgi:deazaflavin-dependent oxidoreductase (nitroreductase family)
MTKPYQRTFVVRLVNQVMRALIRLNLAPRGMYILSVQGRKSGRWYTTPVTLVQEKEQRWLVAPYGNVAWVQNAQAAGYINLTRGQKTEKVTIVEIGYVESAPILKKYLALEPIVRPYFDVYPDATLEAFVAEAPHHPVFQLQNTYGN